MAELRAWPMGTGCKDVMHRDCYSYSELEESL